MKKILYLDMDNTLVDFRSGIDALKPDELRRYKGRYDDAPGIFRLMEPMEGALEAFGELSLRFDTYILSTAPWENPSAWSDKLRWVKKHLGNAARKRLILSHHKHLNSGDFLVDDRHDANGADRFQGELIHFGSIGFPDWGSVTEYLADRA
jgi:5'-nucleotidase